jgi:hypothetical protein
MLPLRSTTGQIVWHQVVGYPQTGNQSPVVDRKGNIYVPTETGLEAFKADGTPLWEFQPEGNIWGGPSIADNGDLLFCTSTSAVYRLAGPPPDTTPPTITVTCPVEGSTYDLGSTLVPLFTITDDSDIESTSATLNGVSVSSGVGVTLDIMGDNSLTVSATDEAGNTASVTIHFTVARPLAVLANASVAEVKPWSQIPRPDLAEWNAKLSFTATKAGDARVEVLIDGQAAGQPIALELPLGDSEYWIPLPPLPAGRHTVVLSITGGNSVQTGAVSVTMTGYKPDVDGLPFVNTNNICTGMSLTSLDHYHGNAVVRSIWSNAYLLRFYALLRDILYWVSHGFANPVDTAGDPNLVNQAALAQLESRLLTGPSPMGLDVHGANQASGHMVVAYCSFTLPDDRHVIGIYDPSWRARGADLHIGTSATVTHSGSQWALSVWSWPFDVFGVPSLP